MSQTYKIAVLPGDGIGREVVPETIKVLGRLGRSTSLVRIQRSDRRRAAIDRYGSPLPAESLKIAKERRRGVARCGRRSEVGGLGLLDPPERALLGLGSSSDCMRISGRPNYMPR